MSVYHRAMRHSWMVVWLMLAACGGNKADYDAWLTKAEGFTKRLCECTTIECARSVNNEFNDFKHKTLTKEFDEAFNKLSADEQAKIKERINRGGAEYERCRRQHGIPDSESF